MKDLMGELHKLSFFGIIHNIYIDNLWVGTNRDNMKDMWDKCRRESNLGERRVA
jgi:hypothetical protein